jgi:hypothetical protein
MVKPLVDDDIGGDIAFIATGGVSAGLDRWHAWGDGGPFGTLNIYHNRIVITHRFPRRRYEFARADITKIGVEYTLWIFRRVRIFHNRTDYPPYISFASWTTDEVLEGFRRIGYPVAGD